VLTWFRLGEGIGRLKCCRRADNQLVPHVELWPRTDEFEKLLSSPVYAQPYAERLLAGENAARRALGKRTDQICSKGLPVDGETKHLACVLAPIMDGEGDLAKEDIVKVLALALNNAQSDWRAWIGERLSRVEAVVHQNWAAIDRLARSLEPHLPAAGKCYVWGGVDLVGGMEHCGVHSGTQPAVEIVFRGQGERLLTKLRRFVRRRRPGKFICRYVKDPAEQKRC
jgi:hypothetical protein